MTFNLKGGLVALALLASAVPAAAQNVEFTLINASSQSLHYFYTNPSDQDAWGEDLLGETGTLEPGMQGTVFIGDGSDQCLYDFRFETGEGALLEVYEVDICELGEYTLTD
ncbi:MAG: hypothetical protein ACK4G5_00070 [Devosia sp.]|jgi:hypothetical protein|uniref:hypothetical protein n=1 Tax=Devosia sp. XGJD_8 TaxID=3391187 RepID=UPI001DE3A935|nr:hypothetical protein [Alphaproteobacteria bacterium]MBU1562130.1 hypothetical protein [Alphaproteobacteria bacterium]MBU2301831.1 hypothetical protein [Alphaproteobacteria bacterium]MBU2368417.1 hypothetical protein [Alphaproteobacteria bacterium]